MRRSNLNEIRAALNGGRFLLVLLLSGLPVGCGNHSSPTDPSPTPEPAEAVFVLRACRSGSSQGEVFRILTRDPAVISEASALVGVGRRKVVSGTLRAGDGGFNAGRGWHLSPDDVTFVDAAMELCDGCPRDIDANLDYWLLRVGRFCPWTTEVVARER